MMQWHTQKCLLPEYFSVLLLAPLLIVLPLLLPSLST